MIKPATPPAEIPPAKAALEDSLAVVPESVGGDSVLLPYDNALANEAQDTTRLGLWLKTLPLYSFQYPLQVPYGVSSLVVTDLQIAKICEIFGEHGLKLLELSLAKIHPEKFVSFRDRYVSVA